MIMPNRIEKNPQMDFTFKTSVNEKAYDFSVNIAGVFWAIGVYFFLREVDRDTIKGFIFLSLSLLVPVLVMLKKDTLERQSGSLLFALETDYIIIVADFLSKFVIYGTASCAITLSDNFEKGLRYIFPFVMLFIHGLFFWVARGIYWRWGSKERESYAAILEAKSDE
jgi:hypothetical protein